MDWLPYHMAKILQNSNLVMYRLKEKVEVFLWFKQLCSWLEVELLGQILPTELATRRLPSIHSEVKRGQQDNQIWGSVFYICFCFCFFILSPLYFPNFILHSSCMFSIPRNYSNLRSNKSLIKSNGYIPSDNFIELNC